jgi:hypothetical protein
MPAALYGALAEEAAREHRSMARQALVAIQRGMEVREDGRTRRRRIAREIEADPIPNANRFVAPAELIREDRSR